MIEIRQPELEALIMARLHAGGFHSVEEALHQALTDAPLPQKTASLGLTTADILAAFQRSPFKDVDIEPARIVSTISDPVEF